MINIIRQFNEESSSIVQIVDYISKKRSDLNFDMVNNAFTTVKGDVVALIEKNTVIVKVDIGKVAPKGSYSFFDFLCENMYDGNVLAMINHIMYDVNGETLPYIRVGTDYYKVITQHDRYNIPRTKLKLWKLSEIKPYHGSDVIYKIPCYDDFTLEPNNVDYQPIINNCYNMHAQFMHEPSMYGGAFPWTEKLMRHVFGEQYNQGMIYLQCLYLYPKKALPILVLVSEERQTGKSSFIDFLTQLFGESMVVINPEDISSGFNSSYSDKNIIAIEESRFDSIQATEKLKNLATQKKILVNAKHQQPYSIPFFGKLIITSNDERKFSKVDQTEIRYWVRKIPSLTGKANHNILDDLVREIPNFLKHLIEMPTPDFTRSRMVFTPEDIQTEALSVVKAESHSQLYKELYEIFEDIFNNNASLEAMEFIPLDIKRRFYDRDSKISNSYIKNTLEKDFALVRKGNRKYVCLDDMTGSLAQKRTGDAYKLSRSYFKSLDVVSHTTHSDAMLDGEFDDFNEPF